eukprot:scaffold135744_cov43-Cyclotella_meneghiniana.AAC.1
MSVRVIHPKRSDTPTPHPISAIIYIDNVKHEHLIPPSLMPTRRCRTSYVHTLTKRPVLAVTCLIS